MTDRSGNAWEWVWNWADFYPECCAVNPEGPDSVSDELVGMFGSMRGMRGGGRHDDMANLRVGARSLQRPDIGPGNSSGFRIASNVQ